MDYWNWIDICSWALNITFIVCDLTEVNPFKFRSLGAAAIFLIWIKLFYFLRLFSPTSNMIRMIIECCRDMASFAFVLLIAMVAFGNVFYILDMNTYLYLMKGYDATDPTATAPSHFTTE